MKLLLCGACVAALSLANVSAQKTTQVGASSAQEYQLQDWKLDVRLVPEKTSLMPGEPIYLSFVVRNGSTQDLQVVAGGDTLNRLGRPERFKVQAVRDDGLRVPIRELPAGDVAGNSLTGPQKIPVGGSYSFSLFLPDWADFKEPGKYTITAARTLDIRKYSQNDMSWTNPANLSHLDVQASAKVWVVPFSRTALGDAILARSRVMFDPDQGAATAAAKALAVIDDDRTIEPLGRAVAESGYSVKFIAVGALARFKNDAALAALKQAARDPDDNIRHAAAVALSKSPHPGAFDALVSLRTDAFWGIRNTVLQALAKMTSAESLELIREMTSDADNRVRTEAQRYLRLRTGAVAGAQSSGSTPSPSTSPEEIARQVERQLDSTDPREVAWGAYNAGAYQLTSTIPRLQRILEAPAAATEQERLALVDAVLDALIQLHADVPASVAFSCFDRRPVQALVLLTMAADRDPTLLHLLTTTSGSSWYSAANILLREKAPGLAPHLLATLTLRVTVIVLDSDPPPGHGSGGSISSGGQYPQMPAGYPPHARYEFAMTPGPERIVLAAGPRTVYYSRTITKDIPDTFQLLGLSAPTDADRIEYLQAMLGPGDQTKLQPETYLSIRWSTPEALIQQVANMRGDIERQYQLMLGVLVRDGRLTSGEAATLPSPIDVQLIDRRKDQSVPLPSIRR